MKKKIEEIINFDEQEQKVGRQNLTLSVRKTLQNSFPRVLPAFPVVTSEKGAVSKYPKVIKDHTWELIHMSDLKDIKQVIVNYGLHSSLLERWSKPGLSVTKPHSMIGLS